VSICRGRALRNSVEIRRGAAIFYGHYGNMSKGAKEETSLACMESSGHAGSCGLGELALLALPLFFYGCAGPGGRPTARSANPQRSPSMYIRSVACCLPILPLAQQVETNVFACMSWRHGNTKWFSLVVRLLGGCATARSRGNSAFWCASERGISWPRSARGCGLDPAGGYAVLTQAVPLCTFAAGTCQHYVHFANVHSPPDYITSIFCKRLPPDYASHHLQVPTSLGSQLARR
jgi:hypothetical protein